MAFSYHGDNWQEREGWLGGFFRRLILGRGKNMTPDTFWAGLIDDIRIYEEALTAEDIAPLVR